MLHARAWLLILLLLLTGFINLGFAFQTLLPFDLALILLELLVFLPAHVVYALIGILRHLVQKFSEVNVLLVRHSLKVFLH